MECIFKIFADCSTTARLVGGKRCCCCFKRDAAALEDIYIVGGSFSNHSYQRFHSKLKVLRCKHSVHATLTMEIMTKTAGDWRTADVSSSYWLLQYITVHCTPCQTNLSCRADQLKFCRFCQFFLATFSLSNSKSICEMSFFIYLHCCTSWLFA